METAITSTDNDALAARASACKVGYWDDPFIKYFVKNVERKAPVINRGTWVRTFAIDEAVQSFLQQPTSSKKQIISLGAGSDTRFFNLAKKYMAQAKPIPFLYHEIDFAQVTQRKALAISSKKALSDTINHEASPQINGRVGSIYSNTYCLHPLDLKDLSTVDLRGIDYTLDTLVISEVCLIYMEVNDADKVVQWTQRFGNVGMIIYEPIRGDDAFGKMMIRNLATRGLRLKTLEKYSTLEIQRQRLLDAGMTSASASSMNDIYDSWIPNSEKERTAKLEMFDEIEEWRMLADHYCVARGWRGSVFDDWSNDGQ